MWLAVSSRGEASGGEGTKKSRQREVVGEEDPYGGSTDEGEDMETDVVGEFLYLGIYVHVHIQSFCT